jgi:hypothetical protein
VSYRESTYTDLKDAIEFMDSLPIDNPDNALWWCLHQVVWHKGVDRVQWILDNKDLVTRIARQKHKPDANLLDVFWKSVYLLKKLDR